MSEQERQRIDKELDITSGGSADPFASAVRATRMPMIITDPLAADNRSSSATTPSSG